MMPDAEHFKLAEAMRRLSLTKAQVAYAINKLGGNAAILLTYDHTGARSFTEAHLDKIRRVRATMQAEREARAERARFRRAGINPNVCGHCGSKRDGKHRSESMTPQLSLPLAETPKQSPCPQNS